MNVRAKSFSSFFSLEKLRPHQDILLVAIIALAIRISTIQPAHSVGYTSDEREYVSMAGQLVQGREFIDSNGERSTRAPLYPYFLALMFVVTGKNLFVASLVGCLLGTMIVVIGFLLALEVWNDRRAALFAAGIIAVYPGLVIYSSVLQTETLYSVFMLLSLWGAYRTAREPCVSAMIVLGLSGGLAALTRAVYLGFFPILLALVWWRGQGSFRQAAVAATLPLLVFCVVVFPWTLRNYSIHGTLVPISSGGGNALLAGNNPFATGTWRLQEGFDGWYADRAREFGVPDVTTLGEVERSVLSGRIARAYIASHPSQVLSLLVKKDHILLFYPITNTDSVVSLQALAVGFDGFLLLAFALGLAVWLTVRGQMWGMWGALTFFGLIQLLFHAEARFRLPLVPLLSIVGGLGVSTFLVPTRRQEIVAGKGARRLLLVSALVLVIVYGITGMLFLKGTI